MKEIKVHETQRTCKMTNNVNSSRPIGTVVTLSLFRKVLKDENGTHWFDNVHRHWQCYVAKSEMPVCKSFSNIIAVSSTI